MSNVDLNIIKRNFN